MKIFACVVDATIVVGCHPRVVSWPVSCDGVVFSITALIQATSVRVVVNIAIFGMMFRDLVINFHLFLLWVLPGKDWCLSINLNEVFLYFD
jgi:hypothetical protein